MGLGSIHKTALVAAGLSLTLSCSTVAFSQTSASITTPDAALLSAAEAYDAAWAASKLAFAAGTFTQGSATGYGNYVKRSDAVFAKGDTLNVYLEPVGFSFAEDDSNFSYKLSVSYRLLNSIDQVLSEEDEFSVLEGTSRNKTRQVWSALSFQFEGLPAGDYVLETLMDDEIGEYRATATLPFSVKAQ
ncbi:MAG: hypothetical protein HWE23_12525 [Rhodobacteraceae bacterium]|nr:hypothetical protein [Paracoccaceae bacterium]